MKNTKKIVETFIENNSTATKNEKISAAMNTVFELVVASTESHIEAMGLLECVKLELQESFTNESSYKRMESLMN